jgi:hypothetical protein
LACLVPGFLAVVALELELVATFIVGAVDWELVDESPQPPMTASATRAAARLAGRI